MNATLSDLGLDSLMGVELRQTLERDYGLDLPMKEIRSLTIGGLQQMVTSGGSAAAPASRGASTAVTVTITQDKVIAADDSVIDAAMNAQKMTSNDFSCNVSALQRYDPSSIMPRQTVVKMNQAAQLSSGGSVAVFAVHPIEGVVTSMMPLMSQLSCPAYGLQCTQDCPMNSVSEMAAFYLKVCACECQ
jgi:fatty acid synthase